MNKKELEKEVERLNDLIDRDRITANRHVASLTQELRVKEEALREKSRELDDVIAKNHDNWYKMLELHSAARAMANAIRAQGYNI